GGFGKGEVTILGGRPAMGKTALLCHFAKSAALSGVPVQIYSLEMKDTELGIRMIVAGGGVNSYAIRTGNLSSLQWKNIDVTVGALEKLPFWVNDKATMTMDNIRINATLKHRKGECGIIFIDYLQLIKTPKGRNRNDEIGEISRQAKELAKELDVPVVLLSQLSRDVAKEADKTPKLIHLRDSGEIEQNADNVLLIHRPAYYNELSFELDGSMVDATGLGLLIVAKNRAGSPGVIPFSHNESLTEITDYQPIKF
ncbi:MAG: DnaB-like helicase C-terminal domain-containing protein, partial [Niameybacter sp.]